MTRIFKPDPVMAQKDRVRAALSAWQETRRAVNDPNAVPQRLDAIIQVVWTVTETIGPEIVTHIDAIVVELEGLPFPVEGDEPLRGLEEKTLTLQGSLGNLRRAAMSVGYEAPESKNLPRIPRAVVVDELEGIKSKLDTLSLEIKQVKQQQADEQENDIPPGQAPIVNKVVEKVEVNIEIMSVKIDGQLIDIEALSTLSGNVASLLVSFADAVSQLGPRVSKWLVKAAKEKLRPTAIAFVELGRGLVTKAQTWIKGRRAVEEGSSAPREQETLTPDAAPTPDTPPDDFDLNKIREDILAGREPKPEWRPWVTELEISGSIHSKDLALLRDMGNLERLSLTNTFITHLDHLEPLSNLRYLDLSKSALTNLSDFEKFSKLEILNLNNLRLNNLIFTESSANLLELNLIDSFVETIKETHFLNKLKKISLSNTFISEIDFINDLKNIEFIDCSRANIKKIAFTSSLMKLKHLNLSYTRLEKIYGTKYVTNIEELLIKGARFTSIHFLLDLVNLKILDLSASNIQDIRGIEKLKNITSLNIANTRINDTDYIGHLKNLKYLNASGVHTVGFENPHYGERNFIDIEFLKSLNKIQYLDLSNTRILYSLPLAELTSLISIDLRGARITDISPLSKLNNLENIYVEANQYEKYSSIVKRENVVKMRG